VADGALGMGAHPCTQFRAVSVSPIRGRSMVPADGAITAKQSHKKKLRADGQGAELNGRLDERGWNNGRPDLKLCITEVPFKSR
jgi:hypothetical protein